jgi:hypothetical protein
MMTPYLPRWLVIRCTFSVSFYEDDMFFLLRSFIILRLRGTLAVPSGGTQGKREGTCERKRRKRKDKIITEAKR